MNKDYLVMKMMYILPCKVPAEHPWLGEPSDKDNRAEHFNAVSERDVPLIIQGIHRISRLFSELRADVEQRTHPAMH